MDYTIDLPAGWNDLTDEYLAANDQSVLAGYWTMAGDLSTAGPYVTMSMNALDPKADISTLSEDAAERWKDQLDNTVRGDSGYGETVDGGVITWASISGSFDGGRRTEHVAHILYGPYYMYLEIDTPGGDEESAHAILDALSSVTIEGPLALGDRAGAPVPRDGTWTSYCRILEADVQDGWEYSFSQSADSAIWTCPESVDILGAWTVKRAGETFQVFVQRYPDTSTAAERARNAIPATVGDIGTTEHGYKIELVADTPFDGPRGAVGSRIDTATTPPDGGDISYLRQYAFDDAAGGEVEVYVSTLTNSASPDTDWLEPFIASFVVADGA